MVGLTGGFTVSKYDAQSVHVVDGVNKEAALHVVDLEVCEGLVHVVDRVLHPCSCGGVMDPCCVNHKTACFDAKLLPTYC